MKDNLTGAVWRFTVFVIICALALFALLAIFAQFRFQNAQRYNAHFANVSGLKAGDFVRIAGVEVGKVKDITLERDSTVTVAFSTDPSVVLTTGNRVAIRYDNLIGGRYLALEEGAGSTHRLEPGDTIPLSQTAPALDLDALIGGFRPLFRALDPDQVNALSAQLIAVFQDRGATIASFLSQTASATNTLADRDELIGQVIANLDTVLGSLADRSDEFDKAVVSLSELVKALAERKSDIATALAYENEAAGTIGDLLSQARPPLKLTVAQTDRAAGVILNDHEYFDRILDTLPDKYRLLGRQGLYGDYFSFYLCDAVLKLNGKGGQPVYVKVVGQDTGRCAAK